MNKDKQIMRRINDAAKLLNNINNAEFLGSICKESPNIIVGTQAGIGRYHFIRIGYKDDDLLLEFRLVMDEKFKDSDSILHSIGDRCFLTASQYLYAFRHNAHA
tara:strand:- start:1403 stop:1714 length:312 start_codon:yes stop_codon:yes gene_type:complete